MAYSKSVQTDAACEHNYTELEIRDEIWGQVINLFNGYGFIRTWKKLPPSYQSSEVYFKFPRVDGSLPTVGGLVSFHLNNRFTNKPFADVVRRLPDDIVDHVRMGENLLASGMGCVLCDIPAYTKVETQGRLYGQVVYMTFKYGLIRPVKMLPKAFKENKVKFSASKVQDLDVRNGSFVSFMMEYKYTDDVKAVSIEIVPDEYYGQVSELSDNYGLIYPEHELPPIYKRPLVYFDFSNVQGTEVKVGDSVVFQLHPRFTTKPIATTVRMASGIPRKFSNLLRRRRLGLKTKHPEVDRPAANDSEIKSENPSFAGATLEGPPPRKTEYTLPELNGLLYGTVTSINEKLGFVEPTYPLPPPYDKMKRIWFKTPEGLFHPKDDGSQNVREDNVSEGSKVVFILDQTNQSKPCTSDIDFVGISYDPDEYLPVKSNICEHICFKEKSEPGCDMRCMKTCRKLLACGHGCSEICSVQCPKVCIDCSESEKTQDKTEYTLLDGLLYGNMTSVNEKFGYVNTVYTLPVPYEKIKSIQFEIPERLSDSVDNEDQDVVFIVNQRKKSKLSITDIEIVGVSYDPEKYILSKSDLCEHICFRDISKPDCDMRCMKTCGRKLDCGHNCLEKCYVKCPKVCIDCSETTETHGKTEYTLPHGLLYGTLSSIDEQFVFIKPMYTLPPPYDKIKHIKFERQEGLCDSTDEDQKVFFILDRKTKSELSITDIEIVGGSYDPDKYFLFQSDSCEHICFRDKTKPNRKVRCMKTCRRLLACGHKCLKKCYVKCAKMCIDCAEMKKLHEKTEYTLSDLDGLLHGTITNLNEECGFVKPMFPLPPPHDKIKCLQFKTQEGLCETIGEGQKAVFILDKEKKTKLSIIDIEFVGVSYDPDNYRVFKSDKCEHVCFQDKRKPDIDMRCKKTCGRKLGCRHRCPKKCLEKCPKMCKDCKITKQKKKYSGNKGK